MIAVGVDVGGTSIKGATIRDNGEILDRFSMPMDKFASPEVTLGKLCELINQTLSEHKYNEKVMGIGIGLPGTFNKDVGYIINCPNLPTWTGFNVKEYLEQEGLHISKYRTNDGRHYHAKYEEPLMEND